MEVQKNWYYRHYWIKLNDFGLADSIKIVTTPIIVLSASSICKIVSLTERAYTMHDSFFACM